MEIVSQKPWHNADRPLDVNDDNFIVAFDALLVINELNSPQVSDPVTGLLPNPPLPPNVPETMGYFDVDGDGYISPLDALLIINDLNQAKRTFRAVIAEGEVAVADESLSGLQALDGVAALSQSLLVGASLALPNDAPIVPGDDAGPLLRQIAVPVAARQLAPQMVDDLATQNGWDLLDNVGLSDEPAERLDG